MQPKRNNYYDAAIRRMVKESLEKKEEAFAQLHEQDSDEMLLEYIRQQAEALGHSPHEKEILGSGLILQRFGDWHRALELAGLPRPNAPDKRSGFLLYIEEEKLQKQLYAQKKLEKKQLARQREAQWAKRRENNGSAK